MMIFALALVDFTDASAQVYRRENRRAGRAFADGEYEKAIKHYDKALVSDGADSLALLYNKAFVFHSDRRDSTKNAHLDSLALKYLDEIANTVAGTDHEFDYHFNRGVIGMDMKDWQSAVDEFKKCLLLDPEDMKARENYIYAKEHLKKEQQQQEQQQQQNQNQNQGQDQQDQQDQGQQNQQDQGQQDQQDQGQQDQQNKNEDQGDQNQNQDNQDQQGQNGQGQQPEPRISEQAAQQILQAMQAKERETQDKVEKKKAAAMKSKQKEKNW
jgi:Ca-activated chloride channel family protein